MGVKFAAKTLMVPWLAWELIVLGTGVLYSIHRWGTLDTIDQGRLMLVAGLGVIVVLLCWPACRLLTKTTAWLAGGAIGLFAPAACAWTWVWSFPIPWWLSESDLMILGIAMSVPSALGGIAVGLLQARRSPPAAAQQPPVRAPAP
jgi:hypothetical protein